MLDFIKKREVTEKGRHFQRECGNMLTDRAEYITTSQIVETNKTTYLCSQHENLLLEFGRNQENLLRKVN